VAGLLACPGCGSPVAPRGWARSRPLRVSGGCPPVLVWLRPRRAFCGACEAWHVLLPCSCLCRRLDRVEVIGRALALAADGVDHRRIAAELGLPESTVRNWLRRARTLAEQIRQHFVRWAFALDPALVAGRPVGGGLAAAVEAVGRCARAAALTLAPRSPWELASALSGGGLLCTSGLWIEPP
jgi:Homeodomain-like domain